MKYLHLGSKTSFVPTYFKFLDRNFDIREHKLLARHSDEQWPASLDQALLEKRSLSYIIAFIRLAAHADKIILHGLFDPRVLILLCLQPWLPKKCVWVLWGGDLYGYRNRKANLKRRIHHLIQKFVVKRVGLITTTVPGDYDLARRWYGTNAEFIECFMYESHVARATFPNSQGDMGGDFIIQVGNSATPENEHRQIFEKIMPRLRSNSIVVVPLTYGDKNYRDEVIRLGHDMFGSKFRPIVEHMAFNDYTNYMASVNMAIFNHSRQQAMGNIIGLISLGKTVYIRSDITPWPYFASLGIRVGDSIGDVEISMFEYEDIRSNVQIAGEFFTEKNLVSQWRAVFAWNVQ